MGADSTVGDLYKVVKSDLQADSCTGHQLGVYDVRPQELVQFQGFQVLDKSGYQTLDREGWDDLLISREWEVLRYEPSEANTPRRFNLCFCLLSSLWAR